MDNRSAQIISLIKREVKPALGCTEPIAVALACAKAAENLPEGKTEQLKVFVSPNILKNGMGVGIPGTGMIGLHIAAALGAVCGKSEYGLEVLKDVDGVAVETAKAMVDCGNVEILVSDDPHILYVKACAFSDEHEADAIIRDSHDNIIECDVDGKVIFRTEDDEKDGGSDACGDYGITVKEIYDFAGTAEYNDIKFILEDRTLNMALAREGMEGSYGLCVGQTISDDKEALFGNSFMTYAMFLTAAASDARMAGCTLPAMSNSGSGNQGITVSMPVIAYAERYGIDDERLARALIMANLVAIHIKAYLGRLSALCGCVVASTGAASGIAWLKGASYEQVCATIKNMIGNITGMVCDGAKVGCAMKVASGVSVAIQSAMLAIENRCVSSNDGIIEDDIEKTIANLGRIGSFGMKETDRVILDIMVCK